MKRLGIGIVVLAVWMGSEISSKAISRGLPDWYEQAWNRETEQIAEMANEKLSSFYEQFNIIVGISSLALEKTLSSRVETVLYSLDEYQGRSEEELTNTVKQLGDVELRDEFDQYLIESEIEEEYEKILIEILNKNSEY